MNIYGFLKYNNTFIGEKFPQVIRLGLILCYFIESFIMMVKKLLQLRDDLRMVDVPLKQPKRKETPPSPPPGPYLTTVEFDDVISEPEGTHSPPCVWRNSKYLFTCSKNCCYRCLSMVCGLPIALIVGCSFACITFQHVWCIGPALRQFTINCHAVKQFLRTALDACIGPCCSTIGLLLSRIRINHSNDNGRTHV